MSISREIVPVDIEFSGGENISAYNERIADNEASLIYNMDVVDGVLVKRPGVVTRFPVGGGTFCYIMGQAKNIGGINWIFGNTASGKIYVTTDGGNTAWVEVLNSVGAVSLNVAAPKGKQYGGLFYFGSQNAAAWSVNLATGQATLVAGSPSGYFGDIILDRMFVWNPTTQIVRYSEAGLGTWPASNSFAVGLDVFGDPIQSMVNYKDRLVIFKKYSIWVLFMNGTPANWQLKRVFQTVGATSIYATKLVDDWIYFIAQHGIYRTNLSELQCLSDPLATFFKTRESHGTTNAPSDSAFNLDAIEVFLNKVYCAVSVGGQVAPLGGTRMFVFHLDSETWTEYGVNNSFVAGANVNIISMLSVNDSKVHGVGADDYFPRGVYMSNATNSNVLLLTDSNAKIDPVGEYPCIVTTKAFQFDDVGSHKKIPYAYLDLVLGANVAIDYNFNGGANTNIPAGIGTLVAQTLKLRGPGYLKRVSLNLTFTSNGGSRDVVLKKAGFNLRVPRPIGIKQSEG